MDRKRIDELKEEEKKHLQEIQRLKSRLREAERMRDLGQALRDVEAAGTTLDIDQALERIQHRTIEQEVRLEMAADAQSAVDLEQTEEELQKARAAELVRQMKGDVGGGSTAAEKRLTPDEEKKDVSNADDEQSVEKTIGRMPVKGASDKSQG